MNLRGLLGFQPYPFNVEVKETSSSDDFMSSDELSEAQESSDEPSDDLRMISPMWHGPRCRGGSLLLYEKPGLRLVCAKCGSPTDADR